MTIARNMILHLLFRLRPTLLADLGFGLRLEEKRKLIKDEDNINQADFSCVKHWLGVCEDCVKAGWGFRIYDFGLRILEPYSEIRNQKSPFRNRT